MSINARLAEIESRKVEIESRKVEIRNLLETDEKANLDELEVELKVRGRTQGVRGRGERTPQAAGDRSGCPGGHRPGPGRSPS